MNQDGSGHGFKLRTFKLFKQYFILDNYLLGTNCNWRREFTKLRISAHTLQIELGRYSVPKVPADKRFCKICESKLMLLRIKCTSCYIVMLMETKGNYCSTNYLALQTTIVLVT